MSLEPCLSEDCGAAEGPDWELLQSLTAMSACWNKVQMECWATYAGASLTFLLVAGLIILLLVGLLVMLAIGLLVCNIRKRRRAKRQTAYNRLPSRKASLLLPPTGDTSAPLLIQTEGPPNGAPATTFLSETTALPPFARRDILPDDSPTNDSRTMLLDQEWR